jgi:hypothetical protein
MGKYTYWGGPVGPVGKDRSGLLVVAESIDGRACVTWGYVEKGIGIPRFSRVPRTPGNGWFSAPEVHFGKPGYIDYIFAPYWLCVVGYGLLWAVAEYLIARWRKRKQMINL